MFVHDSTLSGTEFRGVLFTGGKYTDETGFDPTVGAPESNNQDRGEGPLPTSTTFLPSIGKSTSTGGSRRAGSPEVVRAGGPGSALDGRAGRRLGGRSAVDGFGGALSRRSRHRLFSGMNFEMSYSNGADHTAPQIVDPGAGAVLHQDTGTGLRFTVTATDDVKLYRVLITYSEEHGDWKSLDLVKQGSSNQWSADLPGVHDALYLVQAIDAAGNATYLSEPSVDKDAAGKSWGTETKGPRLFVAGKVSVIVGHGVAEIWWSAVILVALGVMSVSRRRRKMVRGAMER